MADTIFNKLRMLYIILLCIIIISFIAVFLYIAKHPLSIENVGLERWSIILTLGCIFGALKLLNPNAPQSKKKSNGILKLYVIRYLLRSTALTIIFYFNIGSYYFTGTKNFIYLAFIVIFALFLCAPSKKQLEEITNNNN